MPLVRIDLPAGRPDNEKALIGDAVQDALHSAFGVPMEERFQIISDRAPGALIVDPHYLGVSRSPATLIVQVTLNRGRDADLKRKFFRAVVEQLGQRLGIRRSDVVINLVEVGREDWSFGDGEAQLLLTHPH